jgi:hypothetical protein
MTTGVWPIDDEGDKLPVLWHYTNYAGLEGVVKHGRLWASNVCFMNDRGELDEGMKLMRAAVGLYRADDDTRISFEEVESLLSHDDQVFVACLSEGRDELSLWRGYAGQGYALGLRKDALLKVVPKGDPDGKVYLAKVVYGCAAFDERLEEIMSTTPVPNRIEQLLVLLCTYKTDHWRDEREWRLVHVHHTFCGNQESPAKVHVRGGKNWPVPYVELELNCAPAVKGSWENVFHHLVVGPTQYAEERKAGMRWMMHMRGVVTSPPIDAEDLDISNSRISLRE